MANTVYFDEEARKRLLEGAGILYEAVKTTMGPKGRNVLISKSYGGPTVTHDGVTVAKGIDLPEDNENTLGQKTGAELIKQAASKMNDVAGDGTTTVTVLSYHILKEANKLIAAGHNPMLLKKGLDQAAAQALTQLEKLAEPINGKSGRVAEVATISAGDKTIGDLIAEVMEKIGKDGVVTVEEGQGLMLESEIATGFTFDRGYVSPYMVTDAERMEAVYSHPAVVVTDKKIANVQEILPLLEKLAAAGKKDVVLIAEEVEGEALGTLVLNKLKGVFNTVAIKAPAYGDRRKDILTDIAILTGGSVISEDQGITFETADLQMVGSARKVIVGKDVTTIIEGAGSKTEIKARVDQIKAQSKTASEFDREHLNKRAAAIGGKVAVIKVGGASETEIEEKKFRVDDAVAAVKAAMEEGIVAGGGVSLINIAQKINVKDEDSSVVAGAEILKQALQQPFRILMENAGENADAWLAKVQTAKVGYGVDVSGKATLVDMKQGGVVDPVRVTREAVSSAVSIAGTGATMGAMIATLPEAEPPAATGMPGM